MQVTVRYSIRFLFLTLFLFFSTGELRLQAQFSSRVNVSNSPSDSLASKIAIDRQTGKVHTVWADDPDLLDDSDIFYSNSSDGTSFSSSVNLSKNPPLSAISFFPQIAIDGVGAGVGQRVILTSDGRGAREMLGVEATPVRWTIVGIDDE